VVMKLIAGGVLALATIGVGSSAFAAEPANQACVGETFSALAGPGFGRGVEYFAQLDVFPSTRPGLGEGQQILLAGFVPDEAVPNTCND
jgi:hypothetical protein